MLPTRELTAITDLERKVWDGLVEEGRDARTTHDETNWRVGRTAVKAAELFASDQKGKPDGEKEKLVLKQFAVEIGMIDNPKLIYEYKNTAAFWSESAQAHYKDCTWSSFRECSRHALTYDQACAVMDKHGHEPVARIREAITGKPSGRTKPDAVIETTYAMSAADVATAIEGISRDLEARYRVVIYRIEQ